MKIKFADQVIFTLQNFYTSLLIIKYDNSTDNIVLASSLFIIFSLNSFLVNSTYIEFRLKSKILRFSDALKFGFGSVLILIVITINLFCLLLISNLVHSGIYTVIYVISCFTVPICEAVRQFYLNISGEIGGLIIDIFSVVVQLITLIIFWQIDSLNSFMILLSWLVPSWILFPFYLAKLIKNMKVGDFAKYREMGFHLGIVESILSALQLWFVLKVLGMYYDSDSMTAFVIGITLIRPLFMISTLLRTLKLSDIYSTDSLLKMRIFRQYLLAIILCSCLILIFIWFFSDVFFTNFEGTIDYKLLYSLLLLRTCLSFLYAKSYYDLRISGKFGRLIIARILEWFTIYLLIFCLSPKFDILFMNLFLLLGTLIHFLAIKGFKVISYPRGG
jgi:hypothetical protein